MKSIQKWGIAALVILGTAGCKKNNDPEPIVPTETVNLTISELKAKSTSTTVTIAEEHKLFKLKGVVLSDNSNTGKNIDGKSAVLVQADNAAGIIVNFSAAHSFAAGTEVEIGVSNQKLEVVNGEIVLNAIPVDSAKATSTGKTITARTTTLTDIKTNKAAWNGTLVTIPVTGLTSSNGKYAGTLTITDASGSLSSVVQAGAAFENKDLLPSVSKVTGIVRLDGENVLVNIRNEADIIIGDISAVVDIDFVAGELFPTEWEHYTALLPGTLLGDDSFTETGKNYGYIFLSNSIPDYSGAYIVADPNINKDFVSGYKTVTVTFAGSLVLGTVDRQKLNLPNFMGVYNFTNPFNDQTDEYKLELWLYDGSSSKYRVQSESFKEAGKFFTFTFNIPTTKEQLMAGGLQDWEAESWLAKPTFIINNKSTTNKVAGRNDIAPILISKIEIGY